MKKFYQIIAFIFILALAWIFLNGAARASSEYPTVSIDVAPTKGLIQPGQEISIRASTEGFSLADGDAEKMHFNWCLDSVILNTLVTGSSDEIVANNPETNPNGPYHLENEYGNVRGPFEICNYDDYVFPFFGSLGPETANNVWERSVAFPYDIVPASYDITRTLDAEKLKNREDTDNDGLPDEWEVRYFSGRRIEMEDEDGNVTEEFYSTERAELLTEVTPEADPDLDGWTYSYTDACFEDDDEDYHPSWCNGGDGLYGRAETLRIPRISADRVGNDNAIGDGKFTNWEEFVAGTDPLNPDTDGDGIMEELDWAGNQQDLFTVHVEKDWGSKYVVHTNAFGVDQRYKDDEVNKDKKYYRAMYPSYFDPSNEQNITPEGENVLSVGTGLAFESAMAYNPAPPLPGDNVLFKVETSMIGESRGLDLFFRWFLDGEEITVEGGDEEQGLGKKSLQFTASKQPCEAHTVGLEIMERKTRKINYNEMDAVMGFPIKLNKRILGNADLTIEGSRDYNQSIGTEQIWEDLLLPGEDTLISQVSPEQGFRKGDIVEVSVNNMEGWSTECGDENSFEEYAENLSYKWNYTRKEQETKSGQGNNYKSAIFIVTGDPRTQEGATGERAGTLTEQSNEYVGVEVNDINGSAVAREVEDMRTIAPTINFEVMGAEQGTSTEDSSKPVFKAEPGTEVTVSASLNYFRPTEGFDYLWKRNGEIVGEMRGTNDTESSYTFRSGIGPDGQPSDISQDTISLEVVNTVSGDCNAAQSVCENSEQTTVIEKISETPGGVDIVSGALKNFIPTYYRNVFNLSMAAAATCLVVIMALGFTGGTAGKRRK